jgi:multidrug resistance efflux pump
MKVATAQYKLDMAEQKMRSASENLASAHASYDTAQQQQQRLQRLLNDGLVRVADSVFLAVLDLYH